MFQVQWIDISSQAIEMSLNLELHTLHKMEKNVKYPGKSTGTRKQM